MLGTLISRERILSILVASFVMFATLFVTACPLFSEAKGIVVSSNAKGDVGFVHDEPDYGFTVSAIVRNVAKPGPIKVTARLNCDEGVWERKQDVIFRAGETKTLNYFFSEPTVNASNCQYSVSVWPSAS